MFRKAFGTALYVCFAMNLGGCPTPEEAPDGGPVRDAPVTRDAGRISGDPFAAFREQQAAAIAAECECNYERDASPADCVARRIMELRAECTEAGYDAARSASAASFRCEAWAFLRYSACRADATCEDTMALGECEEARRAAVRRCDQRPVAFRAAELACLRTNYVEAPSTCPEPGSPWIGAGVFTGDTTFAGDDSEIFICRGNLFLSRASDRAYRWIAPTPGVYTFDTAESGFATLLSVHNSCVLDEQIACGAGRFTVTATTANQAFIVVVDGRLDGDFGFFAVRVSEPGPLPPTPDAGASDAGRDGGASAPDAGPSDAGVDATKS